MEFDKGVRSKGGQVRLPFYDVSKNKIDTKRDS